MIRDDEILIGMGVAVGLIIAVAFADTLCSMAAAQSTGTGSGPLVFDGVTSITTNLWVKGPLRNCAMLTISPRPESKISVDQKCLDEAAKRYTAGSYETWDTVAYIVQRVQAGDVTLEPKP